MAVGSLVVISFHSDALKFSPQILCTQNGTFWLHDECPLEVIELKIGFATSFLKLGHLA